MPCCCCCRLHLTCPALPRPAPPCPALHCPALPWLQCEKVQPKATVPAYLEVCDIAGLVKGAAEVRAAQSRRRRASGRRPRLRVLRVCVRVAGRAQEEGCCDAL